jgi:hypothetical protein
MDGVGVLRPWMDERRVLHVDSHCFRRFLAEGILPLASEAMERARDMSPGSLLVVRRPCSRAPHQEQRLCEDLERRGSALAWGNGKKGDGGQAVTAYRGQTHVHLFVSAARAAAMAASLAELGV